MVLVGGFCFAAAYKFPYPSVLAFGAIWFTVIFCMLILFYWFIFYGDPLLCKAGCLLILTGRANRAANSFGYTMATKISLPFLHCGHCPISCPYCSGKGTYMPLQNKTLQPTPSFKNKKCKKQIESS